MDDQEILVKIKNFMNNNNYFCLMPIMWMEMFKMIEEWNDEKEKISIPLILAAWHHTTGLMKLIRFNEHLDFAFKKGKIRTIDEYLNKLKDDDWFGISS